MSDHPHGFRAPTTGELAPLFPKYQILSLVATGGMGAVYHAIQTSLDREVAIKILPVEFGKDPGFCESFGAEARAMAKLNHPNLISVYDFGDINGMLFIVMEYVPGQSLHEACGGAAVDPAEVVRLMTGISEGLAHAHQHGILHRDIKPANILLDARLQPKIGDFGLARPLDAKVEEGEAIYGTPGYTAPEVLQPPHTMDQRADIFSLGVLLHELLTGQLPASDPRPPSAISRCDPRFDAVVRKATQPNPLHRYQKAEEIADALRKIGGTAGPRVVRTVATAATKRPAARFQPTQSSNSGSTGFVVALVLVAGVVAVLLFNNQASPQADPTPPAEPVAQTQTDLPRPAPPTPEPEPVKPDVVLPADDTVPAESEPAPVVADSTPMDTAAVPAEAGTGTAPDKVETTTGPQPKFDVPGFLAHARSVMAKRCEPEFAKRDAALENNLSDFKSEALTLMKVELEAIYHEAGEREIGAFVDERKNQGNRVGTELVRKLKFKKWLVELHQQHQQKEAVIDNEFATALAEQQKTYLHGLGIRIKALQQDDPVAAELIKAEADLVVSDSTYFENLMIEALRRN